MNIDASFVSNPQATQLVQPTDCPLDDPSVDAQAAAVIGVASSNLRIDSDLFQSLTMRVRVVCAICVQFVKTVAWSARLAFDGWHIVYQLQKLGHIMSICRRGPGDDRNAVGVGQQMMFRAGLSAIYRAGARVFAPPTARTVALSTTQQLKSIWSAPRSLSKRTLWTFCQIPAFFQSRRRRQQVMPEPQPISWGSISHGMPDRSTKRMPVKHARSGKGLRPVWHVLRVRTGMCGSMIAHNPSETSGVAMMVPPCVEQGQANIMPFC